MEERKLSFVKALKTFSGLGLKESKDICDTLNSGPVGKHTSFDIHVNVDDVDIIKFRKDLQDCTGDYIIGNTQEYIREFKLLSIGIGNEEDYIEYISKLLIEGDVEDKTKILNIILSKFNKDQLVEILSKFDFK